MMKIYTTVALLSLGALGMTACKPTERTVGRAKQGAKTTEAVAAKPSQTEQLVVVADDAPQVLEDPMSCMLAITATSQEYSQLRPWEKDNARSTRNMGVYVGKGRVLTTANGLQTTNSGERRLSDSSRTGPARAVRGAVGSHLARRAGPRAA